MRRSYRRRQHSVWFYLKIVLLVLVTAGLFFLSQWDIEPPVEKVEKVIPHDRIFKK